MFSPRLWLIHTVQIPIFHHGPPFFFISLVHPTAYNYKQSKAFHKNPRTRHLRSENHPHPSIHPSIYLWDFDIKSKILANFTVSAVPPPPLSSPVVVVVAIHTPLSEKQKLLEPLNFKIHTPQLLGKVKEGLDGRSHTKMLGFILYKSSFHIHI
jgi:hypothetical protein